MIRAGVIGSTGYAGAELVRLLIGHPETEICWYGSHSHVGQPFTGQYQNFFNIVSEDCLDDDLDALADEADVIFTATPQGFAASKMSKELLEKTKVIDLSADFRLKDVKTYEAWYNIEHKSPEFLPEAVYGLCELNREDIKKTRLLANPGCYTTCSILTLYPLVKNHLVDLSSLIIDAKSGTSGAGRGTKLANLFCEVNENIKAYGVTNHRHTPEIEEQLGYAAGESILLNFTPHLIPMERGILVTAYADLLPGVGEDEIRAAYESCYANEYFIRLLPTGVLPETRWVKGSNFIDMNFVVDHRTNRVIALGALDNLVKGAAGAAVQNMNLMFGLPENTGLTAVPMFP